MTLSTASSDLLRCAELASCTAVAGGAALRFAGRWTPDSASRFLERTLGVIRDSSRIELHQGGLRSNEPVGLSLHQEDYHLSVRPRFLALLCMENSVEGGQTTLSALPPETIPEELREQRIRFYRRSVRKWTPWRPILEENAGQLWPRIALPDVHRIVEVSSGNAAFSDWIAGLAAGAQQIGWDVGTLVVIDNRISIHGREPMSGTARSLMRWVL